MSESIKTLYLRDETGELVNDITTDSLTPISAVLETDPNEMIKTFLAGDERWRGRFCRAGEVNVLVAGKSIGIGSSRENSAEVIRLLGIQAVVAPTFGPIFKNNLVAQGVVPISNMELLSQIEEHGWPSFEVLTADLSEMQRRILQRGGLIGFMKAVESGIEPLPQSLIPKRNRFNQNGMEKILSFQSSRLTEEDNPLKVGDSVVIQTTRIATYDVFWAHAQRVLKEHYGGLIKFDKSRIETFADHFGKSQDPRARQAVNLLENYWMENNIEPEEGVYMKVMSRKLAVGETVVATDSHCLELATFYSLVVPVGYTTSAIAMAGEGLVPINVAESIKLDLQGELPEWATAKDLAWYLIGNHFAGDEGNGVVLEIGGEGYERLMVSEAAVVTNAATEMGAVGALVTAYNQNVVDYLARFNQHCRGMDKSEIETKVKEWLEMVQPDEGADYKDEIGCNLHEVRPAIVGPDSHKKVYYLDEIKLLEPVNRVIFNSCSGSGLLELSILVEIGKQGLVLPVDLHLADPLVRHQAQELGILQELIDIGVRINEGHSCGPCMGMGEKVNAGEVVVSTNNRNYPGRMGDESAKVYLASSSIAAMTAHLGRVPTVSELEDYTPLIINAKLRIKNS